MPSSRSLGIDLGSAFMALAQVDDAGRSAMFRTAEGDLLIPSVAYFEDDELVVGRAAKQLAATQPSRAAEFVKRDMGQQSYARAINGELLPPEVIEACLLKRLCANAMVAGGPRPAAVLSVPAAFNSVQRKAMVDAAKIAGLDLLGTINDPLAAALSFAELQGYFQPGEAKPGCRVLVFDLGAGKLDVAIVEIKPQRVRVMAVGGDDKLGGRDWDMRLADHLAELFNKQFGEDPRYDMISVRRLLERAEEARQTLTARQQARVRIERFANAADITIARQSLDDISADLLDRARKVTEATIGQAGMAWRDVGHLLLIGGASRMPMIGKMLEKVTKLQPVSSIHAEEAVARGAALRADHLLALREGRKPKFPLELTELTSQSLGLEWNDPTLHRKENVVVISSGTELPCATTTRVTTTVDDQRTLSVQLLEGTSRNADECVRLAKATIRDLPVGLHKQSAIDVQIQLATDGKLQVRATIEDRDQTLAVDVERDHGLTDTQVNEWKNLLASQEGLKPILALLARQPKKAPPTPIVEPVAPADESEDDEEPQEFDDDELGDLSSGRSGKRPISSRKLAIMLIGHVLFATLGLAIGYYILMYIDPSYNWWHLRLPGLEPEAPPSGILFQNPR